MPTVVTAKTALFVWLLAVTCAASVPVTCAISRAHPAAVEPPEPCTDSAEIRLKTQSAYTCAPGGRVEVYPISVDSMLVKCVCPRAAGL